MYIYNPTFKSFPKYFVFYWFPECKGWIKTDASMYKDSTEDYALHTKG